MTELLLLFDIDGTLLQVAEEVAFAQAFREQYGDAVDARWPADVTVSDTNFIAAVIARTPGRAATDGEVANVIARFVHHLEHGVASGALPLRLVAGAAEFVAACAAVAPVAIATGCVEPSARLKLHHAGLARYFACGGFSTREQRRAEIVGRAIAAATQHYGRIFAPSQIVSFGDGPWDVEAAQELGLRFVGINESERGRARLARVGATVVLADYTDPAAIWAALNQPAI
ncbi:MAG: HAD family hydrolase [Deltaproteobacteria bacterium]|nr:HAD family hydrolase [Deltaproteobacteria bacterium]